MTKILDVAQVIPGDFVLDKNQQYIVDFIEQENYCYNLYLHNSDGTKIQKCVPAGDQVIVEL